jgi:hypothetical protein
LVGVGVGKLRRAEVSSGAGVGFGWVKVAAVRAVPSSNSVTSFGPEQCHRAVFFLVSSAVALTDR